MVNNTNIDYHNFCLIRYQIAVEIKKNFKLFIKNFKKLLGFLLIIYMSKVRDGLDRLICKIREKHVWARQEVSKHARENNRPTKAADIHSANTENLWYTWHKL